MSRGSRPAPTATAPRWAWPIHPERYDRRPELAPAEAEALRELGWEVRRGRGHDPGWPQWGVLGRLVRPLDDARAALGWLPDTALHRRSVTDAAGLVLRRCLDTDTAYWGWSAEAWFQLVGPGYREFEAAWPGWVDGTVRPYVAAFAYYLGGFTDFHRIGAFNRRSLAWRVFGRQPVEDAVEAVAGVLHGWGYHPTKAAADQFRTVLVQMMLLNRSPLLEDMTSEAVARLRDDPALGSGARGTVYGIHKALAALGHAGPPATPVHAVMPAIEGVPEAWAG